MSNKCKCIKDTTIDKIVVGNFYKFYKKDLDCISIIYDETDKSFQEAYVTHNWFLEHFKIIN